MQTFTKFRAAIALAVLLVAAIGVFAKDQKPTMKQFILLFRSNPNQPLSEADLKARLEQVITWAQAQNAAGHKLDPRILEPEGLHISGKDRKTGPVVKSEDGPVTAVLFIEAKDFDEAVEVAKGHPGLNFGATVEVRPWAPPAPAK